MDDKEKKMRLGYQEFRKWIVYKDEVVSRFDCNILILLMCAVLGSLVLGLVTGILFFTIEAVLIFIIYLSPRLSRFGNWYLKRMETQYFLELRADRNPKFPLASMYIALLMIGSPLFSFWILNALSLFFVGTRMWLYLFIPIMIISAVAFHPLKERWRAMSGKRWLFHSFLCLLYLLFIGIAALVWWIAS